MRDFKDLLKKGLELNPKITEENREALAEAISQTVESEKDLRSELAWFIAKSYEEHPAQFYHDWALIIDSRWSHYIEESESETESDE